MSTTWWCSLKTAPVICSKYRFKGGVELLVEQTGLGLRESLDILGDIDCLPYYQEFLSRSMVDPIYYSVSDFSISSHFISYCNFFFFVRFIITFFNSFSSLNFILSSSLYVYLSKVNLNLTLKVNEVKNLNNTTSSSRREQIKVRRISKIHKDVFYCTNAKSKWNSLSATFCKVLWDVPLTVTYVFTPSFW